MRIRQALLTSLVVGGLALLAPASRAETPPQITFVKKFEGSQPEFIRVTVERSGQALYQGGTIEKPAAPESFTLSEETTGRVFRLAAQLNYFRALELEHDDPVARMGEKTFIYEQGDERHQVSFNYTENKTARELQELFERIGRGRHWVRELDYRRQFDRLGVMGALRQFERDFNAGLLVDYQQFVPVLERLAHEERLMRLARNRARELLQRIRRSQSRLIIEHGDQQRGVYARIEVNEQGHGVYEFRHYGRAPQVKELTLSEATAVRLRELLRLTNYFQEAGTPSGSERVASGYRITYESRAAHNQVAFAQPSSAAQAELVHLFHRILQQEHFRQRLRAALEKDPLTMQVALQEFGRMVRANGLADPAAFVPLLKKIMERYGQDRHVSEQARQLLAEIEPEG